MQRDRFVHKNIALFFLRKNRTKNDDVYHEISLMDLEIQYGSTEAGRLLSKSFFNKNTSHNDAFNITLAFCVWRQYIEDIKNSQKGRPHPDKKASILDFCLQLVSISSIFSQHSSNHA